MDPNPQPAACILHLVSADLPPRAMERLRSLAPLLARQTDPRHAFAEIPRAPRAGDPPPRLLEQLGVRGVRLCSTLGDCSTDLARLMTRLRPRAVHAWSQAALRACVERGPLARFRPDPGERLALRPTPLLVEAEAAIAAPLLITRAADRGWFYPPTYVCECPDAAERLRRIWVAPERLVIVPGVISEPPIAAPEQIRRRIGLEPRTRAVLLLPPIDREEESLLGCWAVLVLQKLHHDVRVVIPGENREVRRMLRLVDAARQDHVAHFSGEEATLPELLRIADAAVLGGSRPAIHAVLSAALLAGMPIVADRRAVADLDDHGDILWPAEQWQPRAIATVLRQVLENPAAARERTARGAALARDRFDPVRTLAAWNGLYSGPAVSFLGPPVSDMRPVAAGH
ncbi:MAG: glycosyltransferase family 4 protein [Phycisphaerales bacterium]|nr:glycosyltransferase family 4 protein [Phycisphaerales bacterium]